MRECVSASVKLIEQENGRLIQFLFILLLGKFIHPNETGKINRMKLKHSNDYDDEEEKNSEK